MTPIIRNLAFAFGLALILWVGYILFIKSPDDVVTVDGSMSAAALEGQAFLASLQRVEGVELHGEILNDARFESLVDLREDIVPEPVGRKNPFLPIEVGN